jgi:hypothetical protein
MPTVIFYDNNCQLKQHLNSTNDTYFANTIMAVDVFHALTKHSANDTFCVMNCNPARYPELKDGDKWVFNSSAAEQVNKWFGAFQAITMGMGAAR